MLCILYVDALHPLDALQPLDALHPLDDLQRLNQGAIVSDHL